MTKPRKELVHIDTTPFYHCYVRCVRRAYLCGDDRATGENYDHRKQWLVSRIKFLSYIYAIDVCAYAVMSNHYYVVLHVNRARAQAWSLEEVAERWMQLYKGNRLVDLWLANPKNVGEAEMEKITECIESWRERLFDIGWFMRGINETIARMANEEEGCKGRFYKTHPCVLPFGPFIQMFKSVPDTFVGGRYKSQALLDETALLSCMAYVDLNPVRAGMSNDLIASDFTSIQERLHDYVKRKSNKNKIEAKLCERINKQKKLKKEQGLEEQKSAPLMPFDGSAHTDVSDAIPFTKQDYFELVDLTGRAIRADKRGAIDNKLASLVSRLGIKPDKWVEHIERFGARYSYCCGSQDKIHNFSDIFERRWAKGVGASSDAYAA